MLQKGLGAVLWVVWLQLEGTSVSMPQKAKLEAGHGASWSEVLVGRDRPFASHLPGLRPRHGLQGLNQQTGHSGIAAGGDRGRTWIQRLYLLGLGQAEQQQACDATLDAHLLPVALGVPSLPPQKQSPSKERPPALLCRA